MRQMMLAACLLLAASPVLAQTAQPAPGTFTIGADALLWWFQNAPTPVPLVSDGSLGEPGTHVLLGGGNLDTGKHPGLRLTFSYALEGGRTLEGNVFGVATRSGSEGMSSSGSLTSEDLLMPYWDVLTDEESFTQLSQAGVYSGSIEHEAKNSFYGAQAGMTFGAGQHGPLVLNLVLGARWLRFREYYAIHTTSEYIAPFPQDIWRTADEFNARNDFFGAQVGVKARWECGAFYADAAVSVGAGVMAQTVDVKGSLLTDDFSEPGHPQVFTGGYFALPTNIGHYTRTTFGVVPEGSLEIGVKISSAFSLRAGYSALYVNDVIRAGRVVDRRINTTQSVSWVGEPPATLEGTPLPAVDLEGSGFWAQGLNAGVVFRF